MREYTTILGQSIFDLSHLLYGNTSFIVKLVQDNPDLVRVTKKIPAGTVVTYDPSVGNAVVDYFESRAIKPVTSDSSVTSLGIGGGFDSGFDLTAFY